MLEREGKRTWARAVARLDLDGMVWGEVALPLTGDGLTPDGSDLGGAMDGVERRSSVVRGALQGTDGEKPGRRRRRLWAVLAQAGGGMGRGGGRCGADEGRSWTGVGGARQMVNQGGRCGAGGGKKWIAVGEGRRAGLQWEEARGWARGIV